MAWNSACVVRHVDLLALSLQGRHCLREHQRWALSVFSQLQVGVRLHALRLHASRQLLANIDPRSDLRQHLIRDSGTLIVASGAN